VVEQARSSERDFLLGVGRWSLGVDCYWAQITRKDADVFEGKLGTCAGLEALLHAKAGSGKTAVAV